jgi:hypothetical protein
MKTLRLILLSALVGHVSIARGAERLTDLSLYGTSNIINSGATLNNAGTISGAGTFNFSSGTLTLADGQVAWAKVSKTSSSLADLATRSAADLNSGTLPDARLSSAVFTTSSKADVLEAGFFAADAGANDTYVATLSPAITSYVTGARYRFKANTANTGAATINLNSLGAKTIKKAVGGITSDLADNDIRAGQWVDLVYDGTNMQVQSTLGNAASGGSGTVNSGTAGQVAYYATSTTAVSGAVLPKFEFAGTNNVSAYTLYNAMTYPFAKTDTSGRNVFWVGSNDASNPFGMALTATGHASTAASRNLEMSIGGIGANEYGLFTIAAYTTRFKTREGTGNMGLSLVTTDAVSTISHEQGNGGIHIKNSTGTGYVHFGATTYAVAAYSMPFSFAYPAAKTSTTPLNAFFVGSNDASNPFGLNINITGSATAASRIIKLQAGAVGVDSAGEIRLDGTKIGLYGSSSTLSATATSTQLIAETTTAATNTTDGALYSKGGLSVAGKTFTGNDITTSGDLVTDTIGKTVKVKSGSNAKAGTFTLSSGAVTVSNSSVTANSVVHATVKTVSGTQSLFLKIVPTASTNFVVTGYNLSGTETADASTYNYVILEVN